MSSFWRVHHSQKGLHHKRSIQPSSGIKLSSVVHQVIRGAIDKISQVFNQYCPRSLGINLVARCVILGIRHNRCSDKIRRQYEGVIPFGNHGHSVTLHEGAHRTMEVALNLVTTTPPNEMDGFRIYLTKEEHHGAPIRRPSSSTTSVQNDRRIFVFYYIVAAINSKNCDL